MQTFLILLIGFVSGITNSLFGVGGGVVMVPAMALLLAYDPKRAVATSLVVIIPTTLVSVAQKWKGSLIDWPTAWQMIPLAILGSFAGQYIFNQLSSAQLKKVFGGFMILVGVRMLFGK
jgi:uncharacterized membrane protein YfcA